MRVLLSAGEASGDNYGAMLIRELRGLLGEQTEFFGVGGEQMRAAGCETVVDSARVAAVGITEVVRHIPTIYREFFRTVGTARERRPDVAVLIDFPDFNLRLAEKLHGLGVRVVYFVSPQLWAWKKRRIERVRKFVDRMVVIFPFEEKYYRERGVEAKYVGHPLADLPLPTITHAEFAAEHHLDTEKPWIALLPGSRRREVLLNLPIMLDAASGLGDGYQFVLPVASTLSQEWMQRQITPSKVRIHLSGDARAALLHARGSIVASGTATVEAALIGNPFVVVYRLSGVSYAIGKQLVDLPHYAMVNLIAGREIVPELIQEQFTAASVVEQLVPLLEEGPRRAQMLADLAALHAQLQLQATPQKTAITRAAEIIAAEAAVRAQLVT